MLSGGFVQPDKTATANIMKKTFCIVVKMNLNAPIIQENIYSVWAKLVRYGGYNDWSFHFRVKNSRKRQRIS
jgi:hypothetical protein